MPYLLTNGVAMDIYSTALLCSKWVGLAFAQWRLDSIYIHKGEIDGKCF